MLNLADIKATASAVGFDICGVTKCKNFALDKAFLESWIESGFASDLDYLKRNTDKRADATLLVEGAKSVIVCGVNYKNLYSLGYAAKATNKIASYALTTDYHTTIKSMLKQMCDELKRLCPTLSGRCFTDSAPVFEKRYAVEAGLGWIGRQSLLITPQYGSFVLLGVAIISEQCDSYDAPYTGVGCGNCRRCIDACPNSAIIERHIDTRRCISKATIERDNDALPLHGWIFGCDQCQSCCPYNTKAQRVTNPLFMPTIEPETIDWHSMSQADFSLRFAVSPIIRTTLARIRENVEE